MRNYLLVAGVNTGNSLDGADAVVTRFGLDGSVSDIASYSASYPSKLANAFRAFRAELKRLDGCCEAAVSAYERRYGEGAFEALHRGYVDFVGETVRQLAMRVRSVTSEPIDLVGFHGQTCAHYPPSIAGTRDPSRVYTFQLGDGQKLADAVGLPIAFDFRSDDVMNGGEGAPLAPHHHERLAAHARRFGAFPLAFINGGNTANFSFISEDVRSGQHVTLGWDAGPFNEFPDELVRRERDGSCDQEGRYGRAGRPNEALLRVLFEKSALTDEGDNFLLRLPPKSSDPQWYRPPAELLGEAPVSGSVLAFEDRIRTAEYFGAYLCFFALSQVPEHVRMPGHFALCGGGWKNPVTREHFERLVHGEWDDAPLLPEHRDAFERARTRILNTTERPVVQASDAFGFDGSAMEARLFADAAFSRIIGEPFTDSALTGARRASVCGLLRLPHGSSQPASPTLSAWLSHFESEALTLDLPEVFDARWSRASAGWFERLQRVGRAP